MSDDQPLSSPVEERITIVTDLYSKPEYATQLGHMCAIWARLEWQMFLLFKAISGAPDALARSIFYAIESNRSRRDILLSTGILAIERPGDKAELEKLISRIGRAATQRNKYVHDVWGVAQTINNEVFQYRLSRCDGERDAEEVSVNDLISATAIIQDICNDLNSFRDKIAPTIASSHEKLRSRPGISLQFAKKGHPPGRKLKGFHGRR